LNKKTEPQQPSAHVVQQAPSPAPDVKKRQQQAEQKEVAGRHKNDGQMGHKGAR